MSEPQKRQIAYKVRIKDLINGKYIKEEGWNPNHIITSDGRDISRINIIGVIVARDINEELNSESLILDDGTGKIPIRSFEKNNMFDKIEIGNIVLLIGRPREYGSEKYLVPEVLKKISDPGWINVRKLELEKENNTPIIDLNEDKEVETHVQPAVEETIVENVNEDNEISSDKVLDFIKQNDTGEGVDFNEILKIGVEESFVNLLLKEGEIFEVRPGRFKVLE